MPARASSMPRPSRSRRAVRSRVLVCRHRHLCVGARRREKAVPGAHVQCRASVVQRHRRCRPRPARGQRFACAELLFRLGHSHRGEGRSALTIRCPITTARFGRTTTALIALGHGPLRRKKTRSKLYSAACSTPATYMDHRRLPELFCGFPRQRGQGPTLYPVACSPQAWASANAIHTRRSHRLASNSILSPGEIRLRNPRLPQFLDEVTLRDLQTFVVQRRSAGAPARSRQFRSIRPGSGAIFGFRSFFRPSRRGFAEFARRLACGTRRPASA